MLDPTTAPAPAGTAPTAPEAGPTAPPVAPLVEPHSKTGLSPSKAAQMAGWVKDDLAKGRITQAQADKVFDDLGTPPESREPDAQSDEAKAIDAAFPPGKADYTIR